MVSMFGKSLNFIWKCKEPRKVKATFEKNKLEGHKKPNIKSYALTVQGQTNGTEKIIQKKTRRYIYTLDLQQRCLYRAVEEDNLGQLGWGWGRRNLDYLTYIELACFLVAQSCLTLATPWTAAHQAPPSLGFSRQKHWSGLPVPSPGDLPEPGI